MEKNIESKKDKLEKILLKRHPRWYVSGAKFE